MKKINVIFLGTANFSKSVLQGLILDENINVEAVVAQPDRIIGRKKELYIPETKQLALENNIDVFQPQKLSGSPEIEQLKAMNADLIITAAYGQFLPTSFLNSAKIAAINVHASLLPEYRGAAPINWAIIDGKKLTGISIMYMVKEMDAGDIISTAEVGIDDEDNASDLFEKMAEVGTELLLETIPNIVSGNINPIKQDESKITIAPKITPELLVLDFEKRTAQEINNLIRGLAPNEYPYFSVNGIKVKVIEAKVINEISNQPSGEFIKNNKKSLAVVAKDNTVLKLKIVQPTGKKEMAITDFINGLGQNISTGTTVDKL
jgi:methionyl-tRNA formyltransferase